MVIELDRASAATKGQLNGPYPEFNAVTGRQCSFVFDDFPNVLVPNCPFAD